MIEEKRNTTFKFGVPFLFFFFLYFFFEITNSMAVIDEEVRKKVKNTEKQHTTASYRCVLRKLLISFAQRWCARAHPLK